MWYIKQPTFVKGIKTKLLIFCNSPKLMKANFKEQILKASDLTRIKDINIRLFFILHIDRLFNTTPGIGHLLCSEGCTYELQTSWVFHLLSQLPPVKHLGPVRVKLRKFSAELVTRSKHGMPEQQGYWPGAVATPIIIWQDTTQVNSSDTQIVPKLHGFH